jgi:beta-N-acetylhexosaminidase
MVDLTAKPFYLDAAAAAWVRGTIDAMTIEEKIGQLFINLNVAFTPDYLDHILDTYHVGGMRFRGTDAAASR